MTLFLIIFSFFGNIMLANMLVAFLANQFTQIMSLAKYYTLKFQFGLTRALRSPGLEGLFSLPYFLSIPCSPIFLFLISKKTRPAANRLLKKITHIFMVCLPWLVFFTFYLLVMTLMEYCRKAARIITSVRLSVWRTLYLPIWAIIGLPYLLILSLQDFCLVLHKVTDFQDTDDPELYTIRLSQEELSTLTSVFMKIYKLGLNYIDKEMYVVNIKEMVYELGRLYTQDFEIRKDQTQSDEESESEDEEGHERKKERRENHFNRNAYMFRRKYNTNHVGIFSTILQKFISFDETGTNQDIDIPFLLDKIKNNLEESRVLSLVSFHKAHLEGARRAMLSEEKVETKHELAEMKEMMIDLQTGMQQLFKGIARLEAKMSQNNSSGTSPL